MLYSKQSQQKTTEEILTLAGLGMIHLSSVIGHCEDILTTMVEFKSEGDGWVQLESDLPHKSNGIIWFYYMHGDRVALWRGVWSVHLCLEF